MIGQMMAVYLILGLLLAVAAIAWACWTHQFEDQERARFLPLRDLSPAELDAPPPRRLTPSVAMAGVVLLTGLGALVHLCVRLWLAC